ncbi:MAG: polysaccharide biosynthesis C-terminal domain-containing protein [Campylobacteraceae bacterium]|nr:polysaccharide biosynthesis C-terminal domain-containing protein [Campylobacteraceae bacterium]
MLASMDQYFLLNYGYKNELASYIANYNIAEKSVVVILSIISLVFIPTIFKKYKKLEINAFRDIFKVSFYYLLISSTIVGILYFISDDLTILLTNSEFTDKSWIIPYIAFGGIFLGLNSIVSEILTIQYKTVLLLYCYLFGFLINFTLNLLIIKDYGVEGAVITTIISYILMYTLTLCLVYREYRFMKEREKNV